MDQIVVAVAQLGLYAVGLGALAAWVTTPRRDRAAFALAAVLAVVAVLVCVKAAGAAWTDPRPFVVDGRAPLFSQAQQPRELGRVTAPEPPEDSDDRHGS